MLEFEEKQGKVNRGLKKELLDRLPISTTEPKEYVYYILKIKYYILLIINYNLKLIYYK